MVMLHQPDFLCLVKDKFYRLARGIPAKNCLRSLPPSHALVESVQDFQSNVYVDARMATERATLRCQPFGCRSFGINRRWWRCRLPPSDENFAKVSLDLSNTPINLTFLELTTFITNDSIEMAPRQDSASCSSVLEAELFTRTT